MRKTSSERVFWRILAAFAFLLCVAQPAHASMYGCKVLLCLSNPNGPKAADNCPPPIDQLYDDLRHGRSFPTCDKSDGNDDTSYATPTYAPFDPCPAGTSPAPAGSYVVQGTSKGVNGWGQYSYNLDGEAYQSAAENGYVDGESSGAGLACVAGPVGSYSIYGSSRDDSTNTIVNVYSTVIWQQPKNPNAIDVYINNTLWKRVRW